ncbi:DUF1996-containing protein [Aureococcus anophagefferens]|nr:DUF1996-containing protein [Aureococcus anophagefferens]
MFLHVALALAAVRQAGATSMKMDYLRLTNVRTDPITHPGGLSTHVHSFYGASEAAPSTTYKKLRKAAGNTANVEENKSLYWHPTIYRYDKRRGRFTVQNTSYFSTYYIWPTGETTAFPDGFKMIGGGAGTLADSRPEADCSNPGALPGRGLRAVERLLPGDDIAVFTRIAPYLGGVHLFSDGTGYFHADYFSGWKAKKLQKGSKKACKALRYSDTEFPLGGKFGERRACEWTADYEDDEDGDEDEEDEDEDRRLEDEKEKRCIAKDACGELKSKQKCKKHGAASRCMYEGGECFFEGE